MAVSPIQKLVASEQGVAGVDVICPGFSADCLETIEEIAEENAGYFREAGGETLSYIPCLNARDDHLDFLTDLALQHMQGWPETGPAPDPAHVAAELRASKERAERVKAAREAGALG